MGCKIKNNYPFIYNDLEADDSYADFKSVEGFRDKLSGAGYGLEAINNAFAQATMPVNMFITIPKEYISASDPQVIQQSAVFTSCLILNIFL